MMRVKVDYPSRSCSLRVHQQQSQGARNLNMGNHVCFLVVCLDCAPVSLLGHRGYVAMVVTLGENVLHSTGIVLLCP